MLSGVLEDPGQVIVRLTSHIDLVCTEHIFRKLPACCLVAAAGFRVNPRDPLRGRFDKPPPQMREEARPCTHEQVCNVSARQVGHTARCAWPGDLVWSK